MEETVDELEKVSNENDIPNETALDLTVLDFCDISNAKGNEPLKISFTCPKCEKVFTRRNNMNRHFKTLHSESSNICPVCKTTFKRLDNLKRHHLRSHVKPFAETTAKTSPSTSHRVSHSEKENVSAICARINENYSQPIELPDSTRKKSSFDFQKKYSKNSVVNPLRTLKKVQKASSLFTCSVCDKKCSTIPGLTQHWKNHESSVKYNAALNTSTETNLFDMEVRTVLSLKSFPE
ncbi:hypothetical protein TNCT_415461 [Trichonephila clavata]|uniref:C2H2-type domain-containing protein n=1 Tax=Trichonephila clavata TaxID=2740835 RepID=A0A8X6LZ99_TRICU|nr:hypothetical protein TNCT_415461 [Trichonephila clavata]